MYITLFNWRIFMRNSLLLGAILCALASASWGAMFPVADHAFQYLNPYYFTLIRYLPVAFILGVILYFTEGKKSFKSDGQGFKLWFYGFMGFTIYNIFIFVGQDLLGDSGIILASIFEALAPALSVFVIWIAFSQRPSLFTLFTIVGAFIGVLLVVTNGNIALLLGAGRFIPLIILLLAALGWAVYTIGANEFKNWSVLRYSTLSCIYGISTSAILILIASFLGFIDFPTLGNVYAAKYNMLFMIFVPGLFALISWNKGVTILKPINAILFINFAPVTTIVIRLFQGHTISIYEVSGVLLVCAMIIANNIYQRIMMRRLKLTTLKAT